MKDSQATQRVAPRFLALWISFLAIGVMASSLLAQTEEKQVRVPEVFLSSQHQKLCHLLVGDTFPDLLLPDAQSPTDPPQAVGARQGERATLVVFWSGEGYMTKALLRDLAADVIEPFGKRGVAVVAVAVKTPIGKAQEWSAKLGYVGPTLLDHDGKGFAQVASSRLPRVYILDGEGTIVWFDVEYSLATRREIHQTLHALSAKDPADKPKRAKKPAKAPASE